MKTQNTKICAITSILLSTASLFAETFNTGVRASNTEITINAGDTYNTTDGNTIIAINNGKVSVSPDSGGVTINLELIDETTTRAVYARTGAQVNLGTNTEIYGKNDTGEAPITVISASGAGVEVNAVSGLKILMGDVLNTTGVAVTVEASSNLGTDAQISVTDIALNVYSGGTLVAQNGRFESTAGHAGYFARSTVTLTNSDIFSHLSALYLTSSSSSDAGDSIITIDGGSVYSSNGSAIEIAPTRTVAEQYYDINHTLTIKNGAQVSSANNILFQNDTIPVDANETSMILNVEGASTRVEGVFLDTSAKNDTTLSISEGATWSSEGSSNVDHLVLDNANIELTMTDASTAINAGDITIGANNTLEVDFSDAFIQSIVSGLGEFEFNAIDLISGLTAGDDMTFSVAESNDSYAWDVSDLGGGQYIIDNIRAIPEPSTYAAIFGALALGFAAYRRRK